MTTIDAAAAPPAPAYPHPIALPPAPAGDPGAARRLAAACQELASAVEATGRAGVAVLDGLQERWRGAGSTSTRLPADVIGEDALRLARGLREAAAALDDYAARLEHAKHHHGWSVGTLLAVGAVVAVSAVAVVVTVGAAAPVGSVAAVEVGEAIAGAEAATAAAAAAETAAAESLAGLGSVFTGLRSLTAVLAPHLISGVTGGGLDALQQLLLHGGISWDEVAEVAAASAVSSAVTGGALRGLERTALYTDSGPLLRQGLEALTAAGAQTAVELGDEIATEGRVSPLELGESAVSGAVGHGLRRLRKASTRRWVADQSGTRPPQALRQILRGRLDLWLHEGINGGDGHTIRKHVAQTIEQLRERLAREPKIRAASTFPDVTTAERCTTAIMRLRQEDIRAWLRTAKVGKTREFFGDAGEIAGTYVPRAGPILQLSTVRVVLMRVPNGFYIFTSFVDLPKENER